MSRPCLICVALSSVRPFASCLFAAFCSIFFPLCHLPRVQGCCQLVGVLAKHASSQLNICMPLIVPRVTVCLRDTKKEVAKAAKQALVDACSVMNNPDIAPVVPAMLNAIKDPDQCPAALDELMHTTFVSCILNACFGLPFVHNLLPGSVASPVSRDLACWLTP